MFAAAGGLLQQVEDLQKKGMMMVVIRSVWLSDIQERCLSSRLWMSVSPFFCICLEVLVWQGKHQNTEIPIIRKSCGLEARRLQRPVRCCPVSCRESITVE